MSGVMKQLCEYEVDSDSDSGESGRVELISSSAESTLHLKPVTSQLSSASQIIISSSPAVASKDDVNLIEPIGPKTTEIQYNMKYEQLFAPQVGPENPYKTTQQKANKNMFSGFVEKSHVSHFQFEKERRTFTSYGYATDPSCADGSASISQAEVIVGDVDKARESCGLTIFESRKKREGDNRKRNRNNDPADIDGYLGPWGKFVDEQTVMKPSDEEKVALDEILAKRSKSGKRMEEKPMEESFKLHLKEPCDYQGRSFMHVPQDVGVNLRGEDPPQKCFIPKTLIHTWTGHTKGVAAIRWLPNSAHLILSASMDSKIKLWEVYNERRCIITYTGHRQAVRDICFNNDGTKFLSCSYDRYCKLWDTETGQCISRFSSNKVPYCIKFHPEDDKQHLFVTGQADKKIVCWDINSGEVVQEYDRHLGAVNTITFVDQNRRFVSTSDDKSLRIWEWDVPVDFMLIQEPGMHSMPAVTVSPNGKWLACQSMDNQIIIFNAINRLKRMRKKVFKGHMVAGYACGIDFSPEMSYLISGDADGKVHVWDWKTTKLYSKFKAHDDVCIQAMWHPHETSKVATAGWDGLIKLWD